MTEFWYVLNHWGTVVWLFAAGLYTWFAVGSDLVSMLRKRRNDTKAQASGGPEPEALPDHPRKD